MMRSGKDTLKSRLLAKWFSTVLIIVICIFLTISQGSAGPIFKKADKLKAFQKKQFKAPIIMANVPVKIMDLPEPWRDADLVVAVNVVFYSKSGGWSGGMKGYAVGRTIKSQPLKSGSTQGMVHVSLYDLHGYTTGQYVTVSMVMAKLGDQCKILGFGWNFPSDSGGLPPEIKENFEALVGKVGPWNGEETLIFL